MAVGTTSDFNVSRNDVVTLALGMCGVADPSNADISLGNTLLNMKIRHLDADGDWLHAISNTESTLTLVGGQQAYSTGVGATNIASTIIKLEYAAIEIGSSRQPPLVILDKQTSLKTPLKLDTNGQPVAVYLETANLRSAQRMLFYPIPNSAYTVKYHFRRALYDFDTVTDNPDMPTAFALPLMKLLAVELAPHFGNTLNDQQLLMTKAEADLAKAKAGNSDRPAYVPLKTEYM